MADFARTRTQPASLWIGNCLSALEHLSLKSVVQCGMAPVLFSYEHVRNVPDGVMQRDAREVVEENRIWLNKERNSFAPFSDYFRYCVLMKTSYYWIDCDVLALRNFDFESDYFLAWSPPVVSNSVLSLPKESPTLQDLVSACEVPSLLTPWLKRDHQRLAPLADAEQKLKVEDLPYKALGPRALTWLMRHHDEITHVLPHEYHNYFKPRHIVKDWKRLSASVDLRSTYSIHLYGSVQHQWFKKHDAKKPPEGSLLAEMMKKYEVDQDMYGFC